MQALVKLEGSLQNGFLVGGRLTLADLINVPLLTRCFNYFLSKEEREQTPQLVAYLEGIMGRDFYTETYGSKIRFIDEKYPQLSQKEFQKVEKASKAAQKAASKPEKKSGRGVPDSTMKLDMVKKEVINAPDMAQAIKDLATTYDQKAYSFWYAKYQKYEGEGEDLTRTCNLLTNFMNDFTAVGKYVFGVWGVYGDEPSLEMRGVVLWNSPEFLSELKELPPSEYSEWKKLDLTKKEDLDLVIEYWTNRDEGKSVEGLAAQRVKWVK